MASYTGKGVLERIVSGGQTGVDRAALDAAAAAGLAIGGWCPAGRRAEDGPIDAAYPLKETPEAGYVQRTAWNARDSDATLVLSWDGLEGGTAQTVRYLADLGRPYWIEALDEDPQPAPVRDWLREGGVQVLNVAGPRASKVPVVYEQARSFLERVFAEEGV